MSIMKSEVRSQAFLRKRKMLMVLPLLVIPFLTFGFWALGGGRGAIDERNPVTIQGLNLNLPNANLKDDKDEDKLSFYDKADKDSLKMEELMRNDPYYQQRDTGAPVSDELEQIINASASRHNQQLNTSPYEVSSGNPEQKIMQRLSALEKEMNKTVVTDEPQANLDYPSQNSETFSGEVDRLETMLAMMNKKEGDPEMEQIDGTLEKILDIQYPDRVKQRTKEISVKKKEQVFAVNKLRQLVPITLMGQDDKADTSRKELSEAVGFYGTNANTEVVDNTGNAIEAVIHEAQTLVNGSVVKLRLLNEVYINGVLIPKDNFIFGMASLSGERLDIDIKSIRFQQSLFPVKLEVYDIDGLPGIYIPGAISRDVAKQSADNSLQLMELSSMDPSFKAQATTAGIGAAKSLLSKKVKLIKVMVKAGYKVLLKDGNQQE